MLQPRRICHRRLVGTRRLAQWHRRAIARLLRAGWPPALCPPRRHRHDLQDARHATCAAVAAIYPEYGFPMAPPRKTRFAWPLALSKVHWVKPELVCEITYLTLLEDGLLRHTVSGQRTQVNGTNQTRPTTHLGRIHGSRRPCQGLKIARSASPNIADFNYSDAFHERYRFLLTWIRCPAYSLHWLARRQSGEPSTARAAQPNWARHIVGFSH